MNVQDRLSRPITVKQLDPVTRPMLYLHSGYNPNIILVDRPTVEKEALTSEPITYNEPPPDKLVDKLLKDVVDKSDQIKAWAYNDIIPLMLGMEDARNKLSEELAHIFGDNQVSLDVISKVFNKSLIVKSAIYIGKQLGLTPNQTKKIVEAYFNESLERIRSNRSTNN